MTVGRGFIAVALVIFAPGTRSRLPAPTCSAPRSPSLRAAGPGYGINQFAARRRALRRHDRRARRLGRRRVERRAGGAQARSSRRRRPDPADRASPASLTDLAAPRTEPPPMQQTSTDAPMQMHLTRADRAGRHRRGAAGRRRARAATATAPPRRRPTGGTAASTAPGTGGEGRRLHLRRPEGRLRLQPGGLRGQPGGGQGVPRPRSRSRPRTCPRTTTPTRVMEDMIDKGAKIIFATSYGHLDRGHEGRRARTPTSSSSSRAT